ncbi:hypothetical protein AURDEDRAFT_166136 [Auricularia subglabra TFB-10046 SS5]|nr:hypothetical protein AURDEDRAFT_166136 [Auricularia subglabra TFB-10046 SS5]
MSQLLRTPAPIPKPSAQQLKDFLSLLTRNDYEISTIWATRLRALGCNPSDPPTLKRLLSGFTSKAKLLRSEVPRCTPPTNSVHTTHQSSVANELFLSWTLTATLKVNVELDDKMSELMDHAARAAHGPYYLFKFLRLSTRVRREADVNDRLYLTWFKPARDIVNDTVKLVIAGARYQPRVNIRAQRHEKARKPPPKSKEEMGMYVDHVISSDEPDKPLLLSEEKLTGSVDIAQLVNFHRPAHPPVNWEPMTIGSFDNNMQRHLTQLAKYIYSHTTTDFSLLSDGNDDIAMEWALKKMEKKFDMEYWQMQTPERTAMTSLVYALLKQLRVVIDAFR